MKLQRRRKHKYELRFGIAWELVNLDAYHYLFMGLAVHLDAILRFPQLHPHDCRVCRKLAHRFHLHG